MLFKLPEEFATGSILLLVMNVSLFAEEWKKINFQFLYAHEAHKI